MIFSLKLEGPGKLYLVPMWSGRSDNVSLTFTMAAKGGRPVDPIWQVFVRVSTDGFVLKAKSTECETMVSAKVERLRSHRQKCKFRPKNVIHHTSFAGFYPIKPRFYLVLPRFYPPG